MIERGIEGLLPAFFAQAMIGDPMNGYSYPGWVKQIQNSGDTIRLSIPLDNEEQPIMESAMTELRMRDPEAYQILKLYWGHGWSDSKIARMKVPRSTRLTIEQIRTGAQSKLEVRIGQGE